MSVKIGTIVYYHNMWISKVNHSFVEIASFNQTLPSGQLLHQLSVQNRSTEVQDSQLKSSQEMISDKIKR